MYDTLNSKFCHLLFIDFEVKVARIVSLHYCVLSPLMKEKIINLPTGMIKWSSDYMVLRLSWSAEYFNLKWSS